MYTINRYEYICCVFFNIIYVSLTCRYFSSLILVEGMDIDFLHKCALEECTEQHQFSSAADVIKVGPRHPNKNDINFLYYNSRAVILNVWTSIFPVFPPGDGSAAVDVRRHPSPRAGAAGLGSAETHTATGGVQPRHQEDRKHCPAARGVQVHLNHAEGPRRVRK